jgi:adenosylhomocysteine nucleosidase
VRTSLPLIPVCLVIILATSCNYTCPRIAVEGRTAILGAFDEETALLKARMTNRQEHSIEGIKFYTGRLESRQVVLAETGIGKVNAAMVTTLLLENFGPDEVIFSGIAGSTNPELSPGDIVIAEKVACHDYGYIGAAGFETRTTTNPVDNTSNPLFFTADRHLLDVAKTAAEDINLSQLETTEGLVQPRITAGIVVTGDSFIASEEFSQQLRESLSADAVEMEGAAVAQVCYQQNVPFIIIRSISDSADESALADMQKFQGIAAGNSAKLVVEIVRQLALEHSVH